MLEDMSPKLKGVAIETVDDGRSHADMGANTKCRRVQANRTKVEVVDWRLNGFIGNWTRSLGFTVFLLSESEQRCRSIGYRINNLRVIRKSKTILLYS